MTPLQVYFLLFAASVAAFVVRSVLPVETNLFTVVLDVAGSVTCGLAWLLSRALFRPQGRVGTWPLFLVASLFATGVVLMITDATAVSDAQAARVLSSFYSLASSTVLLMTLFETVDGMGDGMDRSERRFRYAFLIGYGVLVGVSVLWFRSVAGTSELEETAKLVCALLALGGAGVAVHVRQRSDGRRESPRNRAAPSSADSHLANRIVALMESEELFRNPDLRVRDIALRAGQPEYVVSQCITGPLGYANFNRLVNAYRVSAATRMLVDENCTHLSILSIAMECGFGSIGPFNRAFKLLTGMTPREMRNSHSPVIQSAGRENCPS